MIGNNERRYRVFFSTKPFRVRAKEVNAGEEAFFQWRRRNDSSRRSNRTASRDVQLGKKNITDRTIVRKGSGDKTPEEGQDLDRQENRRYRSGGDRDRGRGEGSRRGEEAGSRGRGLAVPSAGSVVAAAGHRVPVACANRGRARPTPAARLGLRLPRGHAPSPESDKRVTRSRREAAPRGQNQ